MPLVTFATLTPSEKWKTVLAAIFKGNLGKHVEFDLHQARVLISNIVKMKGILPSDITSAAEEMDKNFADLQVQGIQIVIFNLQPIGSKP